MLTKLKVLITKSWRLVRKKPGRGYWQKYQQNKAVEMSRYFCFLVIYIAVFLVSVVSTNTTCPTWHYYKNTTGKCECGYLLKCTSDLNKVEITGTYCATPLGQDGDYYIGGSLFLYTYKNSSRASSEMPGNISQLEEAMCSPHNRRGFMCGECIDGYGPAVFSPTMKCVNCSRGISRYGAPVYLFVQLIPTTVIFLSLVIFHFNITSGPLLGYIYFCQISSIWNIGYKWHSINSYTLLNVSKPLNLLLIISLTVANFWTLTFSRLYFPPFCVSEKLTLIDIQLLQFFIATYPLVLAITACTLVEMHSRNWRIVRIMCKPFELLLKKTNITIVVTSNAIFRAFASLFLLSNISVIFEMLKLLQKILVHNSTGEIQKTIILIDPTVEWFDHTHIMYLLTASVPLMLTSLLPSLLLLIYPTRLYRYLSRFLSARKRLAITAFAEAIHSCFKDGLNGTTDYRVLGAINLLALIPFGTVTKFFSSLVGYPQYIVHLTLVFSVACMFSYIKPCKEIIANFSLIYHFILLLIFQIVYYLWWYDSSVGTHTLEVTLAVTGLASHLLVSLWAGYTFTRLAVKKLKLQFGGSGYTSLALSNVPERVRLCFWRRPRSYQELQEEASAS